MDIAVKVVTDDMEKFRFNTMLARMMEYVNTMTAAHDSVSAPVWNEAVEKLIVLLAPSVPHPTEELWERTGPRYSVHNQFWPAFEEALTVEETVTLVIQVNGKVRDKLEIRAGATKEDVQRQVMERPKLAPYLDGKRVKDVIYVPNRLVNVVVV